MAPTLARAPAPRTSAKSLGEALAHTRTQRSRVTGCAALWLPPTPGAEGRKRTKSARGATKQDDNLTRRDGLGGIKKKTSLVERARFRLHRARIRHQATWQNRSPTSSPKTSRT